MDINGHLTRDRFVAAKINISEKKKKLARKIDKIEQAASNAERMNTDISRVIDYEKGLQEAEKYRKK